MASRFIVKYALLGGVGISSFLAGTYFERDKVQDKVVRELRRCNVIPVFDTVFAATSFSTSPAIQEGTIVNRVSQIMKYGFPSLDNIRSFDDYILSYDRRNRVAHWVFEHLTAENIKPNDAVDRSKCDFKPDESIHPFFRLVPTYNKL